MQTLIPMMTLNEEGDSSSTYLAFSPRGLLAAQSSATALWDLTHGRDTPGESIEEPVAWRARRVYPPASPGLVA